MEWISRAHAQHGNLFDALQNMPDNISDPDVLLFNWNILVGYGASIQQHGKSPQWNQFVSHRTRDFYRPINYVDENN
jgi:hypothetical protein